jgi:hypothetical protein
MTTSLRARMAATCMAAVLIAACSHRIGGTAIPQPASAPTTAAAGAPPGTAGAPAPSAPATDEDQIRQTLMAFQDSYNTQNWDAYLELMCTAMRAKFTGTVMNYVKKGRAQNGVSTVKILSIAISGDTATANLEGHNEATGTSTASLPLKLEDGWKICQL